MSGFNLDDYDRSVVARLERHSISTASGCRIWTAAIDRKGYGDIGIGGHRRARAHRVAYELLVGPIPADLQLDHLCRNRACINPAHLEPVTSAENTRRGVQANATNCVHGHAFTAENTYRAADGRRRCRTCRTAASARWLAKRAAA